MTGVSTLNSSALDFSEVHASLERSVDSELLPGASIALLLEREPVDEYCVGWANKETGEPLGSDHIFRAFSK